MNLPSSLFVLVSAALWCLLALALWFWLRGTLTPAKFLELFESENVLSVRLVLAAAVVVVTLFMQAAGRLNGDMVSKNYTFAEILLGLGVVKVVASRFAARPPEPPPTINAPKATTVDVAGDATISTPPADPPAPTVY